MPQATIDFICNWTCFHNIL